MNRETLSVHRHFLVFCAIDVTSFKIDPPDLIYDFFLRDIGGLKCSILRLSRKLAGLNEDMGEIFPSLS